MNIKIEDMYGGRDISNKLNETEKKIYEAIHSKLIKSGYICKKGRYHLKGEKVIIMISEYNGFGIRMRLPNIQKYALDLNTMSDHVKNCILNGKNCQLPCEFGKGNDACGRAYVFKFQDNPFVKCRLAYENFKFYGASEEDISSLEKIIDNEVYYLTKPKVVI